MYIRTSTVFYNDSTCSIITITLKPKTDRFSDTLEKFLAFVLKASYVVNLYEK